MSSWAWAQSTPSVHAYVMQCDALRDSCRMCTVAGVLILIWSRQRVMGNTLPISRE